MSNASSASVQLETNVPYRLERPEEMIGASSNNVHNGGEASDNASCQEQEWSPRKLSPALSRQFVSSFKWSMREDVVTKSGLCQVMAGGSSHATRSSTSLHHDAVSKASRTLTTRFWGINWDVVAEKVEDEASFISIGSSSHNYIATPSPNYQF